MYSKSRITQTAATVAALMGIDAPHFADEANALVVENARQFLPDGITVFDRVLMYNPDAIALWLYQKYTDLLMPALLRTDLQIPVKSVLPSVTPVCFASMYTGADPSVHGIQRYEKPVLKTDTLFDAVFRAGKKCAIVAETACSMSKIFLERPMDYFIYDTVDEVNAKAHELIRADEYDLLVVYNGNYDSTMHKNAPEHERSLAALRRNADDFASLIDAVRENWTGHLTFYGFCPDHGCHEIDGGCGSHGLDMDEDMNIVHMFGCAVK
ncbi:MAG: alkaline phosphatase family protein [Eubacteriales bacterium]